MGQDVSTLAEHKEMDFDFVTRMGCFVPRMGCFVPRTGYFAQAVVELGVGCLTLDSRQFPWKAGRICPAGLTRSSVEECARKRELFRVRQIRSLADYKQALL
jgi:hypothetical protein